MDSLTNKELEWDGGDWGDDVFYHPYMAPEKLENSVIDFDIQNLQALLKEKTNFPVEKIAKRVNEHYLDASRLIKRSFGNRIADDFQLFNWGLTLTMDMGLATDKLELLLNVYAKKLPRRITRADFDYIIEKHSSVRHIADKHKRKLKWLDLVASFKIHTVRKSGFPDTIGKRQFVTIMDVNEIDLDLDVLRITKDMKRADAYANRLHSLLLDDPLINGNFREALAAGTLEYAKGGERLRDFESRVRAEEKEFGSIVQSEVNERMRKEFEAKEAEDARRAAKRKAKEEERLAARRQEEADKQAAKDRLEQIRREREEWERQKIEKAAAAAAAERTKLEREKEVAERLRREQEAELALRTQLANEAAAAAEDDARREREELEAERVASVGMFDHLSGEERFRAETAHKLAEHRRIKAIERKRLLEETRIYAESQLARRGGGRGEKFDVSGTTTSSSMHIPATLPINSKGVSTPKKRKTIEDARQAATRETVKQEPLLARDSLPTLTDSSNSPTARLLMPRNKASKKPDRRSESPPISPEKAEEMAGREDRRIELLVQAEMKNISEEEMRQTRLEEERQRMESIRKRLRQHEEEHIRAREVEDSRRHEHTLEEQRRKETEERNLQRKLAEQARIKADRDSRIAEAAALRKHAEEHRLAAQAAEEEKARTAASAKPKGKSAAQLALEAKEAINKKTKADREMKQRAARERARKLQEDNEAKRAALANVIEAKHANARGARLKKGLASREEMPLLDADELWLESDGAALSDGHGDEMLFVDDGAEQHDEDVVEDENEARTFQPTATDSTSLNEPEPAAVDDSYLYLGDNESGNVFNDSRRVSLDSMSLLTDVGSLADTLDDFAREGMEQQQAREEEESLAAAIALAEAESRRLSLQQEEEERAAIEAEQKAAAKLEAARIERLKEAEAERLRQAIELRDKARAEAAAEAARIEREEAERTAEENRIAEIRAQEALEAQLAAEALAQAQADALLAEEQSRLASLQQAEIDRENERIKQAELAAEEEVRLAREAAAQEESARLAELAADELESQRLAAEFQALEDAENARLGQIEAENAAIKEQQRLAVIAAEELRAREEKGRLMAEYEALLVEEAVAIATAQEEDWATNFAMDRAIEERNHAEHLEDELQQTIATAVSATHDILLAEQEEWFVDQAIAAMIAEEVDRIAALAETARVEETLRQSVIPANEKFARPSDLPELSAQRKLASDTFIFDVPKSSDGTLRINIRCDEDKEHNIRGLLVHGFKSQSEAERQGLLSVGDELLAVDTTSLEGGSLEDLIMALRGHQGASVRMTVRRVRAASAPAPAQEVLTAQPVVESPTALLDEVPVYTIVPPPSTGSKDIPSPPLLEELGSLPAVDIELMVPVSEDGKLRLYIRHDDEGDAHGLFIHGFKPNSAAEHQGLLKAGDELLSIAGKVVKGLYLEDVVAALIDHTDPLVPMKVRRHLVDDGDDMIKEVAALELEAKRVALEAMLDEMERQLESLGAEGEADRKQLQQRKQEQIERVMLEQKRQRQLALAKEAEERAKKAAAMPNSLLSKESLAAFAALRPFEDISIAIPKTQGELRIHVKHSKRKGLFVHGFKAGSLAEQQGVLRVSDELLAVEGADVRGKPLGALVAILKTHTGTSVNVVVRRALYQGGEI